ncbi:MAG: hypothetical protein ACR2OD_01685 [Gaiellaceae bacterium]
MAAWLIFASAPPRAEAADGLLVGIHDDAQVLGNPTQAFPTLNTLRAQVIRVTMLWHEVANTRPARGSDPTDPAYAWGVYDRVLVNAAANNIEVVFTIWGTPEWANGGRGPTYAPSKSHYLKAFAIAAQRRYSGALETVEYGVLPRVSKWTAWNEPNLHTFLRPQFQRMKKKGKKARFKRRSPAIYARICNAVVAGAHTAASEAGFETQVACGVTAPGGTNRGDARRPSISPLPFLRGMKARGAKFDVYAHHPYPQSPNEKPTDRPKAKSRISLGSMWRLLRELERLYGDDVPVWITEYAYQTNPPDEILGVSPKKQSRYLRLAYGVALANPKIEMLIWFLIQDERRAGDNLAQGWQSGLMTADGKKKTAFKTFRKLPHP